MQYSLSLDTVQLTADDQARLDQKCNRLDKYLSGPFHLDIRFTQDTHHRHGLVMTCRLVLKHGGQVIQIERKGDVFQAAFDDAIQAMEQKLRRIHDKAIRH